MGNNRISRTGSIPSYGESKPSPSHDPLSVSVAPKKERASNTDPVDYSSLIAPQAESLVDTQPKARGLKNPVPLSDFQANTLAHINTRSDLMTPRALAAPTA